MVRTLFHIGYMKTATTLLQGEVFPRLPDTAFFSYPSGFPHRAYALRDAHDEGGLEQLAADMRGWVAASAGKLALFSWEGLVGDYLGDYRDAGMMLDLMQRVAPEGHVLLVVRRQADLANSLYKQALHRGHWPSFARFVNYRGGALGSYDSGVAANIGIASLDFDAAVSRYERAFGAERVHVLAYEWLRADPDRFWNGLAEALARPVIRPAPGAARNVGYTSTSAKLARRLNRMFRTPHNPRGIIPYRPFDRSILAVPNASLRRRALTAINTPFDPRWLLQSKFAERLGGSADLVPSGIRSAIARACATSNRALDQRRKLGLGQLGYY